MIEMKTLFDLIKSWMPKKKETSWEKVGNVCWENRAYNQALSDLKSALERVPLSEVEAKLQNIGYLQRVTKCHPLEGI